MGTESGRAVVCEHGHRWPSLVSSLKERQIPGRGRAHAQRGSDVTY